MLGLQLNDEVTAIQVLFEFLDTDEGNDEPQQKNPMKHEAGWTF